MCLSNLFPLQRVKFNLVGIFTQPDDNGALGSASESCHPACRLIKACAKICGITNSENQTEQNKSKTISFLKRLKWHLIYLLANININWHWEAERSEYNISDCYYWHKQWQRALDWSGILNFMFFEMESEMWDLSFASESLTPPHPHSLSFGDWHIQLTNVQYMAALHYYPILPTACRRDRTSGVIWGCFLLVSVSHQKHTCWEDFLSINFPYLLLKCYSSHYSDWDPHYIRKCAQACVRMCVFMHVNKDKR